MKHLVASAFVLGLTSCGPAGPSDTGLSLVESSDYASLTMTVRPIDTDGALGHPVTHELQQVHWMQLARPGGCFALDDMLPAPCPRNLRD